MSGILSISGLNLQLRQLVRRKNQSNSTSVIVDKSGGTSTEVETFSTYEIGLCKHSSDNDSLSKSNSIHTPDVLSA